MKNKESKIIYIDIDGPLVTNSKLNRQVINGVTIYRNFNVEQVLSLIYILKKTSSKLVISSDWRYKYSLEELKNIFNYYGINKNLIIGTTPIIKKNKVCNSIIRSKEILKSVSTLKPNSWLAIDDLDLNLIKEENKTIVSFFNRIDKLSIQHKVDEIIFKLNNQ